MQIYYRDQGNEEKAKEYQVEGGEASTTLAIYGVLSLTGEGVEYLSDNFLGQGKWMLAVEENTSNFTNFGINNSFKDISYFKPWPRAPKGTGISILQADRTMKYYNLGAWLPRGGTNATMGFGKQTLIINYATTIFGFESIVPSYSGMSYFSAFSVGSIFSGLNFLNYMREMQEKTEAVRTESTEEWHAPMLVPNKTDNNDD